MGSIISDVGGMFGLGGSSHGGSFNAQAAPLIQPVTAGQVNQGALSATQGLNASQMLAGQLAPGVGQGINSQAALSEALMNQANGVGPNPAQAQLAQNTGQNVANQAALMAGQRGSSANAGLIAREAAQQGAGIQQNAVGQAATLQAQQQLAAQQQLQQLAANQIGQGQGAVNAQNQVAQQNQGSLLGALQGYNANEVGSTYSQNSANAGIAQQNAKDTNSTLGSIIPSVGTGLTKIGTSLLGFAKGGEAKNVLAQALSKKTMPAHLRDMAKIYHPKVLKMACGGMAEGAVVPGDPKVPGKNTEKNDVVPAMLTPKEIVLPLSVTQAKNPGEAAKAFVEKIKGGDKGGDKDSDFKQALRSHIKNRKSK